MKEGRGVERPGRVVEVVEGLAPGAVVVTAGQLKLREGAAVQVAGAAAGMARAD